MMNTILVIVSLIVGVLLGRRTNKKSLIMSKNDFDELHNKIMNDENTHVVIDNDGFGTVKEKNNGRK